MKLFAKIQEHEIQILRCAQSPGDNWYELERDPQPEEVLQYDAGTDRIIILPPKPLTDEELVAQQKAAEDAALMKADTIRALQAEIEVLKSRITLLEKG